MKNKQSVKGKNKNIINYQIKGNNNNINSPQNSGFYDMQKTKETPVKLFNNHVKNSWLLITSLAGFLSNIITIITAENLFKRDNEMLYLLPVSLFLFFLYLAFRSVKFLRIGWWNILNKDGKLYFTKYSGTCPVCGGKLSLGQSKENGLYVWCQYYPAQHRAAFNPLILESCSLQPEYC
jgi:hypothetical protein